MDLDSLIGTYEVPEEPLKVTLPGGEVLEFMRPRSAADLRGTRKVAAKWLESARVLAQGEERKALGELEADPEVAAQAVMLADRCTSFNDIDQNQRRYKFCIIATKCAPIFELIWNGFAIGLVENYVKQVQEATDEGKGDCASSAPIESDSKSLEMSGASTPTN